MELVVNGLYVFLGDLKYKVDRWIAKNQQQHVENNERKVTRSTTEY